MAADRIPDASGMVPRRGDVEWREENGRVVVLQRRRGTFRPAVLRLFGVPPVFRVVLDPLGSDAWRLIDGHRTAARIRDELQALHPAETQVAQRLGHFFSAMVSRRLVVLGAP